MNKAGLIDAIAEAMGGTKASAEQAVEAVIETITKTLKKGEDVAIAGLGVFAVKQRAARQARNPKTGEMVNVPATTVPKFRAAKGLKDAVK